MRAPFQVLVIPYKIIDNSPMFAVLRRADHDEWQFVAGGGEDAETPLQAAKREAFEEGSITSETWIPLESSSYIPADCINERHRKHWDKNTFVIPEYCFGVEVTEDITLSHEHTKHVWLNYDEASKMLEWDSNRTAVYELNCRLKANHT